MEPGPDESASQFGTAAFGSIVRARAARSRRSLATGVLGKAAVVVLGDTANQAIAKLVSMKEQGTQLGVSLEKLLTLPKAVQGKIRIDIVGQGNKILDCGLCHLSSNTEDPVLGSGVYLLWAHLEDDGITIFGHICWICCSMARRRYKGWKLPELKSHLSEVDANEKHANRERFMAWRQADIAFLLANGFVVMTNHSKDGGVDRSKVTIKQTKQILETIDLGSDILWERDAFVA